MLEASLAYRQQMEQHLRNRSYCLITIGAINQLAQQTARVTSATSYLSDNISAFKGEVPTLRYVTMERDWFKADGSMFFPPRPGSTQIVYNQGIVAVGLGREIKIAVADSYDIKGLTIDFSENHPTEFTISNGNVTYHYTNISDPHFICEDIFDNTTEITITPITMSNGEGRLRIDLFYFGVGIQFTNQKILEVRRQEFVSPIASELPTTDLSVRIENYDEVWDINNAASSINYLETGQEIEVSYGYELNDGNIVWIDGGVFLLKAWHTGEFEMSFEAEDRLAALATGIYYGGEYYSSGITLYDLAILVLNDAGVDSDNYILDEYLKDVVVYNPIPAVSHAECLQIIANAGRCRLYIDRRGRICIDAAFEIELNARSITITSNGATAYSDLKAITDASIAKNTYATMESDFLKADSAMMFLPRGQNYLTSGYTSSAIASANGTFGTNPTLTISIPAAVKYYALNIGFGSDSVKELQIIVPHDGETSTYTFTAEDSFPADIQSFSVNGGFPSSDEYIIVFTKVKPNSRVHINNVSFGEITDYSFNYTNMFRDAIGTRRERTKAVDVVVSKYSNGTEVQSLANNSVDLTGLDTYTIYLSTPSYGFSGKADGNQTLGIVDASAYFVTFDTSLLSGTHEISVSGYSYVVAQSIYTQEINNIGTTEQWENPLVSQLEHAGLLAEWIGDYFANNATYSIQYRGEPRLESFDFAYLQNPYIPNMLIQIMSHTLTFNGALSGDVEARLAIATVND